MQKEQPQQPTPHRQGHENHLAGRAEAGPTREEGRRQIAATILLALVLLGLPTLVTNILNDFKLSAPVGLTAGLVLIFKPGTIAYLILIGLFIFRKSLPLDLVAGACIALLMLVGFQSLIDLGFIGSGMLYFLIACALGALFFDGWRAFVPAIVSTVAIAVGGWLWVSGVRTFYFDPADYATSLNTYAVRMVTIFFFLAIIVGSIRRMNSFLTDALHAQTRLNADLRESAEFRKRVFESSIMPIIIMDAESFKYLDCNQAAVDIYQFNSKEETLGKTPLDVSAPIQYDRTPSSEKALYYINLGLSKGSVVFEWRHQRPSGEVWDAEVHLLSFTIGNKSLLQFSMLDITQRKQAEEELQRTKILLNETLQQSPIPMVLASADDLKFKVINKATEDFLLVKAADYLEKTPGEIDVVWQEYAPDGRKVEPVELPMPRALQGLATPGMEMKLDRRDGSRVWQLASGAPIFDSEGKLIAGLLIMQDITERKQAEEALRRSEANLQAIMANTTDIIASYDPEVRLVAYNRACAEIYRRLFDVEIHPGLRTLDLFPEAMRGFWMANNARALAGESFAIELELPAPDGGQLVFESSYYPIRQGAEVVGFFTTTRDITERKQAEQALRESEAKFRSIIESSPVGFHIYTLETDGRLVFTMFNPAADAILRASHAQFVGREILAAFPGLAGTGIPEMYTAVARGELGTQNFEAPYDQGGIRGVYEVRVFQGAPEQAVVNFVDISDRKRAEEAIAQAQKHLAAKNKELEQLVYVASHDLRSPLVNVDGFSRELEYALKAIGGALAAGDPAALEKTLRAEFPDMGAALARIRNSARQMDTLLKGLLKLSRSGRAALHIAPVEMNDLLRQVCASFAFRVQEVGAELTVADVPPCLGDATQLTQVFVNLIDNALKYRAPQRPCQVCIAGQVEGNRVVYQVADNGIGIAAAHQENIFELFHRLDPHATEGEGLGLTIVRQVLGRLDGEITVTSQPGVGSTFIVSLPAAPRMENS